MNRRNFIKLSLMAALGIPVWASALVNRDDSVRNDISEWDKCKGNPKYFINNYVYIQHPSEGNSLFATYDYQDSLLNDYRFHRRNVVVKSRQMGISNLSLAYALWEMTFSGGGYNALFVSPNQSQADRMRTTMAFMYQNLPTWLRVPLVTDNKSSFVMQNGAKFSVRSARSVKLYTCGESLSLFVADETAFCEDMLNIWLCVWPAIRESGKVILTSSLNDEGDWFHDLASNRKFVESNYVTLPWHHHPNRDLAWKSEMKQMLGDRDFAREFECRFI